MKVPLIVYIRMRAPGISKHLDHKDVTLFSIIIAYLPCMLFFAGVVSQLFLIVEARK